MIPDPPRTLPAPHRGFLMGAVAELQRDARIAGVAIGGSYLTDTMDEFSDLDLVIAVEADAHAAVLAQAKDIATRLGTLLVAFTGEHVGEPRLLICLYDEPLLHVDLKIVALPDVATRVEDPAVLWERDGRVSAALRTGQARYPAPDLQWIEDRFWVWVHYVASKVARGELFDAIESLSALRTLVLGPLALQRAGARPSGVRRIESSAPDVATRLESTLAGADARICVTAMRHAVTLYRELRATGDTITPRADAERAALRFLDQIERRVVAGGRRS